MRSATIIPQKRWYGKSPKILNTKLCDKMTYANSADPDQTAPAVWSGSTLFVIPLYFKNLLHKKQSLGQNIIK